MAASVPRAGMVGKQSLVGDVHVHTTGVEDARIADVAANAVRARVITSGALRNSVRQAANRTLFR